MSSTRLWQEEKYPYREVSEMTDLISYCYVLDAEGKQLSPTKEVYIGLKILLNMFKYVLDKLNIFY